MTIKELPSVGANNPRDHVDMSYRFLDHAQKELDRGRRLQASEKVWGSAAHLLKAIGKERGWENWEHGNLRQINAQMAEEFGKPQLRDQMRAPNDMHKSFYENVAEKKDIQRAIDQTREYVDTLDEVRRRTPQTYTITSRDDQTRVGQLLNIPPKQWDAKIPVGSKHTKGFSVLHGGTFRPPGGPDGKLPVRSPRRPLPSGPPTASVRDAIADYHKSKAQGKSRRRRPNLEYTSQHRQASAPNRKGGRGGQEVRASRRR